MGQRNILCPNQMIGFEPDRNGQNYLHPDPCILFGANTNFAQPNIRNMVSSSGSIANVDLQYSVEHCNNPMIYGMPQYNGMQRHPNLDLAVAPAANYYYSYMTPSSGGGALPAPRSHGASGQLPSSSSYGVIGISADEHGSNGHFTDDIRGPCKRKYAEGIPGSFQHNDVSSSSSSSASPLNTRHPDGVSVMDATSFDLSLHRGAGTPSLMEVGPQSSLRNRSGATGMDSLMMHEHNHLVQGNYLGQPFQPAGALWLDQQLSSTSGDGGTWNQPPAMPYVHGSNANGGSMETRSMGVPGYHDAASNRTPPSFQHPPPVNHRHHSHHHPSPPMLGVRGPNINFQPQVAAPVYRGSTNSSRSTLNPVQNSFEMDLRHLGSVLPTGLRMYRPHRGGFVPEANLRHRNLPHLRVLQAEETAILDMPDFYEVGNLMDHHRDMRLDIEHMSYEDLLALGEQIGNVSTGLSEETVTSQLRTKTYASSASVINLEEAASGDQEVDSCIICQDEYQNQEKIGILDCGHEYHAGCLKKWLLLKNACPICKSEALTTGRKDV
ncbi:probable E3 ubiquitin-protein ligase ZFP1 isoform X1 [Juglans microcarpa x Juglans regia]|uniref:probable E3 ubiquitin-protein ligase ZFP1 isoform X1 n=2 Tax=Juglans microcarpa x Juglans regia TaxID=2249226 RepID=UPI001B7F0D42|nr:probable E3 ubiquitin-protein ligase ZFP1 isoform X1 [Juglans microcarpa x Juglans regia]XP_040986559.1 probable E3 ubiquitin-protein ligase ZFP1 isoform X1 [Juglans microcarpa x Juglans regia]XP_040986560.1 probable E3 ubiquitin-protein ligase ZFP1 isoform X1 [Juglans microcarpa x Juglans regia]XP_040986561.1 probable E3 ubiquitin-protein ligase ZFP1 isoform X1 [Juglans microcarpa x Juglans regia]